MDVTNYVFMSESFFTLGVIVSVVSIFIFAFILCLEVDKKSSLYLLRICSIVGIIGGIVLFPFLLKSEYFKRQVNDDNNSKRESIAFYIEKKNGKYNLSENLMSHEIPVKEKLSKEIAEAAIADETRCSKKVEGLLIRKKEKNKWSCICYYDKFISYESCISQKKKEKRTIEETIEYLKQKNLSENRE